MPIPARQAALLLSIASIVAPQFNAQSESRTTYQANVNMVALTFSVADGKGNYVAGLKADDVRIFEDGVEQKIAAFAEGSRPPLGPLDRAPASSGTSVFILFDTSNRMYSSFPYVCDSIADFVRGLDPADSVAIYTFSKNLSRAAPLTADHVLARAGLSNAVAGDGYQAPSRTRVGTN
jgi:Ca-activated chloride channel family protein